MSIPPDKITIAITVYSRRAYIKQAIASALAQTIPVRVIVQEDCGPDATLQAFVKEEFGGRIEYFRSTSRRGIFGNWNACLEQCQTEWISILHDDDFLAPNFVASMQTLAQHVPDMDLYCGHGIGVNERNEPCQEETPHVQEVWRRLEIKDFIYLAPFWYPGQLFRVSSANALGRFRVTSHCSGDWELWTKLAARGGAAQTRDLVAFYRIHGGWDKGLNQLYRNGKHIPATIIQHKRVLALLPPAERTKFDRAQWQRRSLTPIYFLLECGASLSPRLLRYHVRMLLLSPAPHWRYAVFQQLARVFGPPFVSVASLLYNRLPRNRKNLPGDPPQGTRF